MEKNSRTWNKKSVSWIFYDWANSAFATTVMAGFFPIFFKAYWSSSDAVNISTAKLATANSLAGIAIALIAPVLGAISDKTGKKTRYMGFFTLIGSLSCIAFQFVNQGNWELAIAIYILASIGFFSSNIFYDSMLPEVSPDESKFDIISSGGFALGYLGGGLLFLINVMWAMKPDWFGFASKSSAVKASFVSVGVWWLLFAIPVLSIKSQLKPNNKGMKVHIKEGFLQIKHTFKEIKHLKPIFTFLLAYWLYIDGVDTIIRMASDYGLSIGFSDTDLISALLLIQFLGFPFTFLIGYLTKKTGRKKMIFFTILVYIVICFWAAFIKTKYEFFAIAFLISTVQGGIQAISRAYFASLIPPEKSAEYFGFYNMLGKFAVVFGPLLMGITNIVAGIFFTDKSMASRSGILSVVFLFILGIYFLNKVNEKEARKEISYL